MTRTVVLAPIIAALLKSEDILGKDRVWRSVNEKQALFLRDAFSQKEDISYFSEAELKSWVSFVAAELNAILAREGFGIRLNNFYAGEFGVVSILDVLVEWLVSGAREEIRVDGTLHSAVRCAYRVEADGKPEFAFGAFTAGGHSHPILSMATRSGDRVNMTIAGSVPASDWDVMDAINGLRRNLKLPREPYTYAKFPMVDLDQQADISWLMGMCTNDTQMSLCKVGAAKQQTKFKMNEHGARVKSAVAIHISRSLSRGIVIDQPFYLWIDRPRVSLPFLYAYIDKDAWKDPGILASM